MNRRLIVMALGVCAAGMTAAYASMFGSTYNWISGSGDWSDTTKWTPAGVPDIAGEEALIGASGTYTVTMNISPTIDSLSIGVAGATLQLSGNTLTMLGTGLLNTGTVSGSGSISGPISNGSSGNIHVPAGSTLNLSSATITSNGNIVVNSNNAGADTILNFVTACTLSGTGRLSMIQQGTWSQLTSNAGVTLTNGALHTIGGRGNLTAQLNNLGTVVADSSSQTLTLFGQPKTNSNMMKAMSGGTLRISGVVNQTTFGQIFADNSNVGLSGGSITGGTLNSAGASNGFFVDGSNFTVANITNNANLNIAAGQNLTVGTGVFANNGVINVNYNQAGAATQLTFSDNVTVSGSGTIQMSQVGTWAEIASAVGKVVTITSTQTVKGRGQISATLANAGTINADWASQNLVLNVNPKSNSGTMKASSGGGLRIETAVTQTGAGTLFADNSPIGYSSGSVFGGTLTAAGTGAHYFDNADFTIGNITLNAPVNVAASRTLNVGAGSFVNNNIVAINYNFAGADTKLNFLENTSITGTGTIQMSQNGSWAQLTTAAGKTLTLSSGQTVKGRGIISATLVNNGLISADWGSQTLELSGGVKTNNATMKSNGINSALSILDCVVNQAPTARIFAESSNVGLRGTSVVTGGRFESAPTFGTYADQGSPTVNNVTNLGDLNIAASITLNVGALGLTNNGTININYNQNGATTFLNFLDTCTVAGSGTIQMSQNGTWAQLTAPAGKVITLSSGQTVKGRGQISAAFVNNGLINADWGSQTLELLGENKTNNATMKSSTAGSVLSIRDCVINQAPSARILAEGANVGYRGTATINGGRLESISTFGHYFDSGAPTVNGVTNLGSANIAAGQSLNIGVAGMVNNGTLSINYNQAGANTILNFPASATLSGSGTVQMSQNGTWAQIVTGAGATLTNEVGHTIQGRGQINGQVINKGSVKANWGSQTLEINQTGTGFSNQGNVEVAATSGLAVSGGNYVQSGGETKVNGSMSVGGGNAIVASAGEINGSGTINAPVQANGTTNVAPGNSAGKLTVNGTYTQASTAKMTMELGGITQSTEFDYLQCSGAVNLNGTLTLKMINSFLPTSGQTFTIVTGSTVTGQFSNVIVDGETDLEASVVYTSNSVIVTFLTEVNANNFTVDLGVLFGGNIVSLSNSDNNYVYILCDEDNAVGQITLTGTSPFATITKLRFAFESAGDRTDITEFVELFNYTTNAWVGLPPNSQTTIADRRRVLIQATNPGQYVKSGNNEIKARLRWVPFQDLEAADGWSLRVDQASWFLGQ